MFSNRYLLSLRERYNHLPREPRITSKLTPSLGQVVQIKGESKDRNDWKIGKITSLIPSVDGQCRAAKVQVGKNVYTRSIAHLYPLEMEDVPGLITSSDNNKETHPIENFACEVDNSEKKDESQQITIDLTPNDILQSEQYSPIEVTEQYRANPDNVDIEHVSNETENEMLPEIVESSEVETNTRTKRAAATEARKKIMQWTRELNALLLLSGTPPLGSVAPSASF